MTWEQALSLLTGAGVVWTAAEVFFGLRTRIEVQNVRIDNIQKAVDGHPQTVSDQLQGIRDAIDRLQEDIRELREKK